ncbi:MAG TPA: hypothetical protein VI298_05210 [Geobacteraceae bacterium]
MRKKRNSTLEKLIKKSAEPKVASSYWYHTDIANAQSPGEIKKILGLGDEHCSPLAKKICNLIEAEELYRKDWLDFKWKLAAFITIQDVFDAPIFSWDEDLTLFKQWYFYYESKYILTEAILCGLNGFTLSVGPMMRLFLEFSLLQNYYYRQTRNNGNYEIIQKYFSNKFSPNWNTIITGSLPADDFCKPIKKRLQLHLKALSENASHPYQPS